MGKSSKHNQRQAKRAARLASAASKSAHEQVPSADPPKRNPPDPLATKATFHFSDSLSGLASLPTSNVLTDKELLDAFTERFRVILSKGSRSGKRGVSLIVTSRETWLDLHRRFDRGDTSVFTGKKDGTNRKVMRRNDGAIIAVACGREVADEETLFAIRQSDPTSSSMKAVGGSRLGVVKEAALAGGRDASLQWRHDTNGEYLGATCDGVFFPKAELEQSTSPA